MHFCPPQISNKNFSNYRKLFLNVLESIFISLELNFIQLPKLSLCVLMILSSFFFYSFIDILSTLESAGHVYTFKKKKTVYEYTYMCRKKHMKIHRQCNTRRQPYGLHFLCKKKSAIHQQHSYID